MSVCVYMQVFISINRRLDCASTSAGDAIPMTTRVTHAGRAANATAAAGSDTPCFVHSARLARSHTQHRAIVQSHSLCSLLRSLFNRLGFIIHYSNDLRLGLTNTIDSISSAISSARYACRISECMWADAVACLHRWVIGRLHSSQTCARHGQGRGHSRNRGGYIASPRVESKSHLLRLGKHRTNACCASDESDVRHHASTRCFTSAGAFQQVGNLSTGKRIRRLRFCSYTCRSETPAAPTRRLLYQVAVEAAEPGLWVIKAHLPRAPARLRRGNRHKRHGH